MKRSFDYIVIGAGSGGLASARRAAKYGKNVAIIESTYLGGTCVNVGCVPKKITWNACHILEELKYARHYGISVPTHVFDFNEFKKRRDAYLYKLNEIYRKNLINDNVSLIRGLASFKDAKTIEVQGAGDFTAPHILIATGSAVIKPNIPGSEFLSTSDDFFALDTIPRRVLIIGNGYIAAETSNVFNTLGTETSIAIRGGEFLGKFDRSITELLTETMTEDGIKLLMNREVVEVRKEENEYTAVFSNGETVKTDFILVAIGRAPNTSKLNLKATGVIQDKLKHVLVDEYENTNIEGIHAVGDVTGKLQLTPVAVAAGRKLADRLFGGISDAKFDYDLVPTVMFTHPPIGTIGYTERAAREKYRDDIKVYISKFNNMYYALGDKKVPTLMKLICLGIEEKVIGLHAIGRNADEMIQGFGIAMKMGATKKDFDNTAAIHPTASEEFVTMR